MQQLYWGESVRMSYSHQSTMTDMLKAALGRVRKKVKSGLTEIEPLISRFNCDPEVIRSETYNHLIDLWISKVNSLSSACNKDMVHFTFTVIEDAIRICGSPPCEFAAVGIGSIARGETTPYSDLEFLFMVKDKTEECYFERLAVTTYFLIGNLGETKLKYMNIEELVKEKWFEDESQNGFKIDGLSPNAGNIPTGNGSEEKRNKFIGTVEELVAEYGKIYREVPSRGKALKGDLSAMLSSTVLLYGSERMMDEFTNKTGAIEATDVRYSITHEMLVRDEKKFLFQPNSKVAEKIELKDQIYRYPTILMFDLKIYFKLFSSQCWTMIYEMIARDIISVTVGKDLEVLVATAIFIRLSVYAHYNSQDNRITIWTVNRSDPEAGGERKMWTISKALLRLFFTHLLPVKNMVKRLTGGQAQEDGDTRSDVYYIHGLTSFYCEDYESFLALAGRAPESYTKTEQWKLMRLRALRKSNRLDDALKIADQMVAGGDLSSWCESFIYNELGSVYRAQGRYEEALKFYSKCLKIELAVRRGRNHLHIATSYGNIGFIYFSLGQHGEALKFYSKCLAIQLAAYGNSNQSAIATSYCDIGLVYRARGEYGEALKFYNKCLTIQQAVYGDSNHPDIATSYGDIGSVYYSQGKHRKALEFYKKCFRIRLVVYGDSNHPDIATSYGSIGLVYRAQGEYWRALEFHKKCLAIRQAVYGNSNQPAIATSYCYIGSFYFSQGEYG